MTATSDGANPGTGAPATPSSPMPSGPGDPSRPTAFVVTTPTNTVTLDASRAGTINVTVTNVTGRPVRVRAAAVPLGTTDPSWVSIQPPAEQEFALGGTQTFTAAVKVPQGAPAGTYTYRVDAIAEDRPEYDFTEGQALSFAVPAADKKPFPWWIVAVVAAVVILGGAIIFFLSRGSKPSNQVLPAITGTPQVLQVLTAQPGEWEGADEFTFQWQLCDGSGNACDDIESATLNTFTPGNTEEGRTVRVQVTGRNGDGSNTAVSEATSPIAPIPPVVVAVPDVVGLKRSAATALLSPNFQVAVLTSGPVANTCDPVVNDQNPNATTQLEMGEQVAIATAPLPKFCFVFKLDDVSIVSGARDFPFKVQLDEDGN